jgi:hypothetical protein
MSVWSLRSDHISPVITDEFGWGSHTACGETCNECMRANISNLVPTYAGAQIICERDRARHWTDSPSLDSQWMGAVFEDMVSYPNKPIFSVTLSYPPGGTYGTDQLALLSKSLIGRQGGILLEVSNASALPYMEQGVRYHFVVLGAYDDTRADGDHFLLLNPDRFPRHTTSVYGGDWVNIFQLAKAGLYSMLKVTV